MAAGLARTATCVLLWLVLSTPSLGQEGKGEIVGFLGRCESGHPDVGPGMPPAGSDRMVIYFVKAHLYVDPGWQSSHRDAHVAAWRAKMPEIFRMANVFLHGKGFHMLLAFNSLEVVSDPALTRAYTDIFGLRGATYDQVYNADRDDPGYIHLHIWDLSYTPYDGWGLPGVAVLFYTTRGKNPAFLSKLFVHELGHYFRLPHWKDDQNNPSGQNDPNNFMHTTSYGDDVHQGQINDMWQAANSDEELLSHSCKIVDQIQMVRTFETDNTPPRIVLIIPDLGQQETIIDSRNATANFDVSHDVRLVVIARGEDPEGVRRVAIQGGLTVECRDPGTGYTQRRSGHIALEDDHVESPGFGPVARTLAMDILGDRYDCEAFEFVRAGLSVHAMAENYGGLQEYTGGVVFSFAASP